MRSYLFLFNEFIQSLSQNRFLHFTYGAQVTISLLVMGVFFVLLIGAAAAWGKLGSNLKVHVFLDDDLSARQLLRVEEDLQGIEHVHEAIFRGKEKALEQFNENNPGIPLQDLLDENPFPDSYIIQVDRPIYIQNVVDKCESTTGVLTVKYGQQIVQKYIQIVLILAIICVVTLILLLIFTYSSINNIIGLSIYARRAEIRIMQLVGATAWFIRWPFLFEGMFIGFVGGVVASLIIWLLLAMVGEAMKISQLSAVVPGINMGVGWLYAGIVLLLVVIGLTVGFTGSMKAVNGFLAKESRIQLDARRVRRLIK